MFFVGVDVGTGSVRAALVSGTGKVVKTSVKEIKVWSPVAEHYEQSSDEIWEAVCECVKVTLQLKELKRLSKNVDQKNCF